MGTTADGQVRDFLRQINLHPDRCIVAPGTLQIIETHDVQSLLGRFHLAGYAITVTPPTPSIASMAPIPTDPSQPSPSLFSAETEAVSAEVAEAKDAEVSEDES